MYDAVTECEGDPETQVMIITGAGNSWCAGQDLKEYFREGDKNPQLRRQASWCSQEWRWRKLFTFPKPTIAMVNGFCFGGAFTPLVACDFAIASDDALFRALSEVNWGILPGGLVSRVVTDMMSFAGRPLPRHDRRPVRRQEGCGDEAGELFGAGGPAPGRDREAGEETHGEEPLGRCGPPSRRTSWCAEWTTPRPRTTWPPRAPGSSRRDAERGYDEGIKQFIDDKTYKPGLGPHGPGQQGFVARQGYRRVSRGGAPVRTVPDVAPNAGRRQSLTQGREQAMRSTLQKGRAIHCCRARVWALARDPGGPAADKPFYQGKTLKLIVDYSAGGPTDIECRIYARHSEEAPQGRPHHRDPEPSGRRRQPGHELDL